MIVDNSRFYYTLQRFYAGTIWEKDFQRKFTWKITNVLQSKWQINIVYVNAPEKKIEFSIRIFEAQM